MVIYACVAMARLIIFFFYVGCLCLIESTYETAQIPILINSAFLLLNSNIESDFKLFNSYLHFNMFMNDDKNLSNTNWKWLDIRKI